MSHLKNKMTRITAVLLAMLMVLTVAPIIAFPASAEGTSDEFMRIFHLDCGRKYFSVSEIEGIIDQLAANHYTHIQLAFGNDGFRFLLNEMSVEVNGTTYSSEKVRNAIISGNSTYSSEANTANTMLSESEMDTIIDYAKKNNISVIPMLNTPGHMNALVAAMKELGIRNSTGSEMNLSSENELKFIKAIHQKYITYFAGKESERYNFAADEYSFNGLSNDEYTAFAKFVNDIATMVKTAKMMPMCYNDGINYSGKTTSVPFDTDIQICYWSQASNYASVSDLSSAGFKIINNNDAWYYVLGDYLYKKWAKGQWGYEDALNGIKSTPVTQAKNVDDGAVPVIGSVLCCWCDGPEMSWSDSKENVYSLIKAMADANPDYFKASEAVKKTEIELVASSVKVTKQTNGNYKVKVNANDTVTLTLTNVEEGKIVSWASDNEQIAVVDGGVVTFTGVAGTAKITATVSSATRATASDNVYTAVFDVINEETVEITEENVILYVNQKKTYTQNGFVGNPGNYSTDDGIVSYVISHKDIPAETISYSAKAEVEGIGEYESYYVSNLIDGNTNTKYWSNGAPSVGSYVQIDLGAAIPINALRLTSCSGDACKNAAVKISTDNATWKTIGSYSGSTSSDVIEFSNEVEKVRYIKIEITEKDGYWWQLAEVEWGTYADGKFTRMATSGTVYTEAKQATEITFEGKAEGTTSVIIGNIKYNITVTAEDITSAPVLPIQLWITNISLDVAGVTTKTSLPFNTANNGQYAYYVSAKASDAYGEKGVLLSRLVPVAVNGDKGATSIESGDALYVFWKGTVLNTTTGLQKVWWNDMSSADGRIEYQYVRYFGGAWAVSADRVNWTTVTGDGSTGGYSGYDSSATTTCTEQVIAYYMQRTDVTDEVITDVVQWGNTTEKWGTDSATQYVVLDFAVKYPDGTVKPGSFPADGKSMYLHCNENESELSRKDVIYQDDNSNYYRRLGLIKAVNSSGYEVYMITVTPTSDTITDQLTNSSTALSTSTVIKYNGTEKVVWVDTEDSLPAIYKNSSELKYSSISGKFGYSVGGEPNVGGLEIYQRQGMLVTYYLRPVVTLDSLNVHYIDSIANQEFYTYPINVVSGTVFDRNIGLANPWKGKLLNGNVENDQKVEQWVSADLSGMPAIGAQYRYAKYTCVDVKISDDSKDVYLYYTFEFDATFVVDFGTSVRITPTEVSQELAKANITGLYCGKAYYADIATEGNTIVYTPNTILKGVDTFTVIYKGVNSSTSQEGTATFTIRIIPASTVYYEDGFIEFDDGWKTTTTEGETPATDRTQGTHELGAAKGNNDIRYGYDSSYGNDATFSAGSAHVVTVTPNSPYATAKFTFTGTGFDLVSVTDTTTGVIFVQAVNKETGAKQTWFVDTFYGVNQAKNNKYIHYTWTKGTDNMWHVKREYVEELPSGAEAGKRIYVTDTSYEIYEYNWEIVNNKGTLYQIPVMSKTVAYGTYDVTVKVVYSGAFDHNKASSYKFYIDGVRIYNTLGETYADYEKDDENNPTFDEVRDILIGGNDFEKITADATITKPGTVFIDGLNETGSVDDFKKYGPNNEVYLKPGQAIAFKVAGNAKLFIGAKAPTEKVTMLINGESVTISTATDMYYPIAIGTDGKVVIANANDVSSTAILSITTIKATGGVATYSVDSEVVAYARAMLLEMIQPPVFTPELIEASWTTVKLFRRSVHTLTVRTSADVDHITVDGKEITDFYYSVTLVGSGWNRKLVKCKMFTVSYGNDARLGDYDIVAFNAEGVASEPHKSTLTGKPGVGKFN